jgi:predicted dehydrogenase
VNHTEKGGLTRRQALQKTGALAAASAFAGMAVPQVHAGEDNTINVALIGCGGRGRGAAVNALSVKYGPTKLVAMADVFADRLKASYDNIASTHAAKMDVPDDRKFIGFDAYQKAMDCLKPGDVAIFATPPGFRWVHFTYAIQKGLNVFMEKPVTVDGPATRRMFKLAEESEKKNMKVGVGLMCRHCAVRGELFQRIRDGQLGELLMLRAYRMAGPTASAFSHKRPIDTPSSPDITELQYQIRRFHSFLWASGGAYSDFLIHNIDECCWMKDAWPVKAESTGGRQYRSDRRGELIDQNFDTYATEFTFPDGTKLFMDGRCESGCHQEFASYAHGTKGAAIISYSGHSPCRARIFKGQNIKMSSPDIVWKGPDEEPDPYQLEWEDLIGAIRQDKPYNEVRRGAEASLVTSMGRMSAHTGQVITRDQILNSEHEFAPDIDKLVLDGPAPLQADADGRYPVPEPGKKKMREY